MALFKRKPKQEDEPKGDADEGRSPEAPDPVDEEGEETFPASDPPAHW